MTATVTREFCGACLEAGEIRPTCPRCDGEGVVEVLMKVCKNPHCPRGGEPFNVYQAWKRSDARYCSRDCRVHRHSGVRVTKRRVEGLRHNRMADSVGKAHIEHNVQWMQPGRRVLDRSRNVWGTLRPARAVKTKRKDVGPNHMVVIWDDGDLSYWLPRTAARKLHPGPFEGQGPDEIVPLEEWLEGPS